MIEVKEQYIKLTSLDFNQDQERELAMALDSNSLNNVLISLTNSNGDFEALASFLEKKLETTNGLACFTGVKDLGNSQILKDKNHVIVLPTEHEGIEAIMMNILENEFLKGE